MRVFLTMFVLLNFCGLASPVTAQSSPAVMEAKIDAIQRQLRILQRRVNGGAVPTDTAEAEPTAPADRRVLADILAKMATLDRQMRQLNGRLEEYEYRQNEMTETLAQIRQQMALQREQMLAQTVDGSPVVDTQQQPQQGQGDVRPEGNTPPADPLVDTPGEALPAVPAAAATIDLPDGDAATQYSFAFAFIRKNDLDSGRIAMEKFMEAHPADPQAANAKFWLGRINMQQSRNAEAAQLFLSLIEDHPNHDKRVDALVDLSDVLIALGAAGDACNALAEFRRIEDKASERLKARARRVSETARCDVF